VPHDIGLGETMLKDMHIRSTDSAEMDLYQRLAFLRAGFGNVLDFNGSLSDENRRLHLPLPTNQRSYSKRKNLKL
jgi:hypothetical protein